MMTTFGGHSSVCIGGNSGAAGFADGAALVFGVTEPVASSLVFGCAAAGIAVAGGSALGAVLAATSDGGLGRGSGGCVGLTAAVRAPGCGAARTAPGGRGIARIGTGANSSSR